MPVLSRGPFGRCRAPLPAVGGAAVWFAIAIGFLAVGSAHADSRQERPLQLQVDLPGLSVGYHINDSIYIGITHHPRFTTRRFDDGGYYRRRDELYGQEGVDHVETKVGTRDSLEVRISPWEFGFYFALGAIAEEGDSQHIVWERRGRRIGNGDYITALRAEIDGKPNSAPGAGLGFNHVFEFGLSLGVGIFVGLSGPESPKVDVEAFDFDSPVAEEDLLRFKREIKDRFSNATAIFHLAIGYNF